MKNNSSKTEIGEKDLTKVARLLRNQNIALRKLIDELMLEEERKSEKQRENK